MPSQQREDPQDPKGLESPGIPNAISHMSWCLKGYTSLILHNFSEKERASPLIYSPIALISCSCHFKPPMINTVVATQQTLTSNPYSINAEKAQTSHSFIYISFIGLTIYYPFI